MSILIVRSGRRVPDSLGALERSRSFAISRRMEEGRYPSELSASLAKTVDKNKIPAGIVYRI